MSLSMYQASIPVFIRMLTNLSECMKKGEAFATAKNFPSENLVNSRLAPDMFPFSRQIQIATDVARRCAARLAGVEPPSVEDNEKSMDELQARIQTSIDYLKGFKPEQIDGSENKALTVEIRKHKIDFTGQQFLQYFALPNVYFHVTTAYNILRHNDVDLGKPDYLGSLPE